MASRVVTWPKVLLYGNSITQYGFSPDGCWGTLIADKLQRKCDILNRGFSGYTSRCNSIMLPRIVDQSLAKDLVAVTIFLGCNDSTVESSNQHVPLDEYKENMSKIVEYFCSVGVKRDSIIMIGPPPCHIESWQKQCDREGHIMTKDNTKTGKYAETCAQVATDSGVEYVELYKSMMDQQDWSEYLSDGLHFSAKGSRFLFDKLWPLLQKRTDHLPAMIMPYWRDLDMNDPAPALLND